MLKTLITCNFAKASLLPMHSEDILVSFVNSSLLCNPLPELLWLCQRPVYILPNVYCNSLCLHFFFIYFALITGLQKKSVSWLYNIISHFKALYACTTNQCLLCKVKLQALGTRQIVSLWNAFERRCLCF